MGVTQGDRRRLGVCALTTLVVVGGCAPAPRDAAPVRRARAPRLVGVLLPPRLPAVEPAPDEAGAVDQAPPVPLHIPPPEEAVERLAALRAIGHRQRFDDRRWHPTPVDRGVRPDASISVGNVTTGHLVRGKALPPSGPGFRVLAATRARGFVYGADTLVAAIERAAARVARQWPGSVLRVGNLSRAGGGDIPQSVSHNAGRDVDLGLYAMDRTGAPVDVEGLVAFDASGRSVGHAPLVWLDARRTWALVEALLTDPEIQVQYVFVADWIRDMLLDAAIRAEAPMEIVVRAQQVLRQPQDSSPHDDHLHVRIYCDLYDRLHGCHDFGVVHPWVETFGDAVQARIDALVDMYQSGDPAQRAYVLEQLDLLRTPPPVEPGGE